MVLVEASRKPAQARLSAALPSAIAATMAGVGELDLKEEVHTVVFRRRKGCER